MFDCIIVGAGPAGGTAAYHLAKKGRSVLVIEKESFPSCLLYTSPSPRDATLSRMPSSA